VGKLGGAAQEAVLEAWIQVRSPIIGFCGHSRLSKTKGATSWAREVVLTTVATFRPSKVIVVGNLDLIKLVGESVSAGIPFSSICLKNRWRDSAEGLGDRSSYEILLNNCDVLYRLSLPKPEKRNSQWAFDKAFNEQHDLFLVDSMYGGHDEMNDSPRFVVVGAC